MKNSKIYKKFLSMLTAGVLFATPVAAHSESNNNENTTSDEFTLVTQEKELTPLTMDEYYNGAKNSYDYLSKFVNYNNLQTDLQCLYYLTNRQYIPSADEADLINFGIVFETDINEGKYENFMRAYNLINVIGDYNQSTIKELNNIIDLEKVVYENYDKELLNKYLTKAINNPKYNIIKAIVDYNNEVSKIDPELVIELGEMCLGEDARLAEYLGKVVNEDYDLNTAIALYNDVVSRETYDKLIDVSKLCYGDNDRELVHDMHENWFKAYLNGKFYNEDYQMVFKQLTTLNAAEQMGNAKELSVGARWLAQNTIGGAVMQMLRDDMQEDFTRAELDKYFDKKELNKGQWILRSDMSLDLNCLKNELEVEVFNFGQLWAFVYDHVNDDIMKSFQEKCTNVK